MQTKTFKVEPFSCPSCVKKIESTVGKLPGVSSVKVLFNSSKVKVEFDGSRQTDTQIAQVITKLGYPVLEF